MAKPRIQFVVHRDGERAAKAAAKLADVIMVGSAAEAKRTAEWILNQSKKHHVPIDQGDLLDSGAVVEVSDGSGEAIEYSVRFGGGLPDPRAVVIEFHPLYDPPSWLAAGEVTFHPHGRGPGYLSIPSRDARRSFPGRLRAGLRNYLKKVPWLS